MNHTMIKLRSFVIDDVPEIVRLAGDRAVSRWASNIPHPYTEKDAIDWLGRMAEASDKHAFAVDYGGRLAGCVSFWPFLDGLEVGYWVGRPFWGRGIATSALDEVQLVYSFPPGRLLYGKTMALNAASQRVLEKAGFRFWKSDVIQTGEREIPAKYYRKFPPSLR